MKWFTLADSTSAYDVTARNQSKGGTAQEFGLGRANLVFRGPGHAHITLNFAKLEFDYRSFKQDGGVNQEKSFKWDFSTNKSF